jgi:nitrate reductase cytochrome c-type subunit
MRIRVLTIASLLLAASTSFARSPLDPQSPIDWPPKAVPKQAKGKVPDFTEKNLICMDCHKDILSVRSTRKNVPNLHQLHLASKKIAYKGENRDCLVCHESVARSATKGEKKENWFNKGDVFHPNVMRYETAWKRVVVRPAGDEPRNPADTLQLADPYIYKLSLKRLVCLECHGPDSKVKTLFGAPVAGK